MIDAYDEEEDYGDGGGGGGYSDSGDSGDSGSDGNISGSGKDAQTGGKYTTVGVVSPIGVGAAVTVTDQGDKLVSVVVGNPGKIITTGTTPAGVDPKDWLSGPGASANLPNGVGIATNGDNVQPTVSPPGTAGASVSYTIPLINNPVSVSDQIKNVINSAIDYSNHAVGIPQPNR
ncbi:hypothetical protein GTP56_17255 [Duganella sp. FT134W]|uniref:Uncharacterized protein n=1 Tax=Duganella margarita TaxID=2692170 RepID=A0A7X4H247_9BURK|nr:hypothetical protein [Duganella margarita]MYM73935.1 hypothetical protein [Duganella margarita]